MNQQLYDWSEPRPHYVPLRRPCDDPHANFEKIRTVKPKKETAKAPAPIPKEALKSLESRLRAKRVII